MIYILGTERSASTWVANILDHHPRLDVCMEPLSSYNSRFKNWPDRFTKMDHPGKKAAEFECEFEILRKHRRFLFTRFSDSHFAWKTDLNWAQFLARKNIAPDSVSDFLELNFHRKNRSITVKKKEPLQTVIKEVRLNFNASLISAMDKNPRVIVTIREMASCIRSISNFIDEGSLTDLKKDLQAHYGSITPQTLCNYWFESYSVLLDSLENHQIPYKIVSHTELLKNPRAVTEEIFRFLDISVEPDIIKFLETSDRSGSGKHSTERSSDQLLEQIINDRKRMYPLLSKELDTIQNHPVLRKFSGGL